MSVTEGLIDEELQKIVAGGEEAATDRDDGAIIAEASRRACSRAGLMVDSAPSAAATEHWAGVLGRIRDEGNEPGAGRSAVEEGVRARPIPEPASPEPASRPGEGARATKRLAIDLPPWLHEYVLSKGGAPFVYLLVERHYRDAAAKARAREAAAAPADR